jgi:thiosulfate/3-mercaptopyruvate sulfurtransferase
VTITERSTDDLTDDAVSEGASGRAASGYAEYGYAASSIVAAGLDGPLVSTQWLADHLGADGLVVLDATVVPSAGPGGRPTYLSGLDRFLVEGHIPGSVFADLLDPFSDPSARFPFTRPGDAAFAAAAASVGVGADTTVVIYDAAVGQWASRLWYLFRSVGHDRVAVLDGGVTKWRAEGRPVDLGHVEPASVDADGAGPIAARSRAGFWAGTSDVAAIVDGSTPGTLVCGTPPRDFAARHIPGSVSAPAVRLVDRETNALLPAEELRGLFADVLDAPGPIVAYCGAGIAATADALALAVLGRTDVLVYDGSLAEWTADPDAPLASSPAAPLPAPADS